MKKKKLIPGEAPPKNTIQVLEVLSTPHRRTLHAISRHEFPVDFGPFTVSNSKLVLRNKMLALAVRSKFFNPFQVVPSSLGSGLWHFDFLESINPNPNAARRVSRPECPER